MNISPGTAYRTRDGRKAVCKWESPFVNGHWVIGLERLTYAVNSKGAAAGCLNNSNLDLIAPWGESRVEQDLKEVREAISNQPASAQATLKGRFAMGHDTEDGQIAREIKAALEMD